ncbi:MAG TPA: recombinase family protein [Actinomycetota bacterium]|nr:recombinase family protein [Actinomycetota bacterium]
MALRAADASPLATAIYCRISQDGEGSGLGVSRQEEDCRELAERRGWLVAGIYVDNDVSAYSGKIRPQYRQMLQDIRDGVIDGLIVWHLDRLHRRPMELEEFFEICDRAGLRYMASVSGDIDLSTDDGRFHARILGAVARKESDDKSRRIKRKHVELAKEGRHLGGVGVPLGYSYEPATKELSIEPAQAEIVRLIFDRFLQGFGLRQIAREVEERRVIGKRGRKRWTNGAITKILDNPTYAAYRHYQGELTEGNWEPLIAPEEWRRAQALREAAKAATPALNRKGKGKSLLSALLFCECGEAMWRDTYASADHRSAYKCRRSKTKKWGDCEAGGVSAVRAERLIEQGFIAKVSGPFAAKVQQSPKSALVGGSGEVVDATERELHRIEQQMERLIELSLEATGPLAAAKFREKSDQLETRRKELLKGRSLLVAAGVEERRRLESISELRARMGDLPKIWQHATGEERSMMLRLCIDSVVVRGPGRPKKLQLTWADWLGGDTEVL